MRNNLLKLLTLLSLVAAFDQAAQAAAPASAQGSINFRTYAGDQRAGVRARTAVPDGSFYPKRMEGPYNGYPGADSGDDDTAPQGDYRNNYNMELIGYFYPPKTGNVMFAICTDDPGELWLSTDDNPVNKVQIASESQWNPVRNFAGGGDPSAPTRRAVRSSGNPSPRPENWSEYINVVAGKPYFIQAIGTEFGGGDNNAVAFRYDTDPDFSDGDKPIPGKYLSPFYAPTTATILSQPTDVFVYAGGAATFSVAVDVGPTATISSIKWQKNGVDIPDSNKSTLVIAAKSADDGAKFKAIITSSIGTVTSAEAVMNVATLANTFAPGIVKWEVWRDISGNAVSALTDDPRYPNSPDEVRLLPAADAPVNIYEAFGARLSGIVIPDKTGDYVFFASSDDNGELFLSTDENPANKKLIAKESAWSNTKQWAASGGGSDLAEKRSDQSTVTEWPTGNKITLTAGKKYYFELLYKEGGGGDNGAVNMILAGTNPTEGVTTLSGPLIGANTAPNKGTPQITKQPVPPAVVQEGLPLTLSVDGVVIPAGFNFPVIVQWQKNGVNIPGASSKIYTNPKISAADSGTYRAVLSAPSGQSTNSAEVAIKVVSDTFPPTLVNAVKSFKSNTKVLVIFSERVSAATANVAANYKLNSGATVSSAALASNGKTVELTTSAIATGTKYQLTVSGVKDEAGNTIAANASIDVGVQKGIYFVTTDPGPLTFPGDIAVNQHLLDRGFDVELARGSDVPDDGSTALGRDLIIESSTLGSGTVEIPDPNGGPNVSKFKTLAIPAMDWEASSVDAFGFRADNATTTGGQTQVNIVDPSLPLAAGFPKGLVTVTTAPETFSQSVPTGDAHIVATLANDPSQGIIYYYDKGEKGYNGFVMPARRVFFFFQDNTAAVANDNGWKLFDTAVDWLLGVQIVAPPTAPRFTKSTRNADGSITLEWTGGGTLQAAASITGPWQDVAGANSPYTFKPTAPALFGRIKK